MRYSRAMAVAVGAFMLVMPMAYLVSAKTTGHDEGLPIMVTKPQDGDTAISCAVYFADNMVFAPQWRVGNLVRIEMMIINMTDFDDPRDIENSTINLPIRFFTTDHPEYDEYLIYKDLDNDGVDDPEEIVGVDQQKFLLEGSTRIAYTSMVSVSYICVTITGVSGDAVEYEAKFEASWLVDSPYTQDISEGLGREVNKNGNLIYGMQWDTEPDEGAAAPAGEYRVDVQLGDWYTVDYAVGHLYVGDGVLLKDENPYIGLVPSESEDVFNDDVGLYLYADLGIGLGGVDEDTAWVLLGPLIAQGPGGGNGGDGGDGGGNGEENGGNGLGNLGNRLRG